MKPLHFSHHPDSGFFSRKKILTGTFVLLLFTANIFAQPDTIFQMTPPPTLTLDGQSISEGDFTLVSFSMFNSTPVETVFGGISAIGGTGATFHAVIGTSTTHYFTSTTPSDNTMIIAKFAFQFDASIPDLIPINSTVLSTAPFFVVNLPNGTGEAFHQAFDENGVIITSTEEFTISTIMPGGSSPFIDLFPNSNPGAFFATTTGVVPISGFGQGHGSGGIPPLPIELIYFKGEAENGIAHLSWATELELNYEGFFIEHSHQGLEWEKIGFVKGKDNIAEANIYHFYHHPINSGIHYYRLKQKDHNGDLSYSNAINIKFKKNKWKLTVFPNPSQNGVLTISFVDDYTSEPLDIKIYNSVGMEILNTSTNSKLLQLNTQFWSKGMYFISANIDGIELTEKIVVN